MLRLGLLFILAFCPAGFAQPRPNIERGGKACWFVDLPAWKSPPGCPKPKSGLMQLEFRENFAVADVVLVGLQLHPENGPVNRSTITHSVNKYWISMKGKERPRLATDDEWNAASEFRWYHGHCDGCREAENRTILFGSLRLVPSHSDQHTWVWVRPNESPDNRWLMLDSWSGGQYRTGSDIFTGGSESSSGYSYFDVFDMKTGKKALTFGGFRENSKNDVAGFFLGIPYQPLWLAPHYIVGDLTEKSRSFLFCNPDLAPSPK